MPPKKQENVARFRVTLPQDVYNRIEALAASMGVDVATMVRIMASLQLVQWENMANPFRMLSPGVQQEIARGWAKQAGELFPEATAQDIQELQEDAERLPVFNPEPEPVPVPVDRPAVGFRPKGELEDFASFSLLEDMLAGR